MNLSVNSLFLVTVFVTIVQVGHGQDFFISVRRPQGICPTHELDSLRPDTNYIISTTTILPGQSGTDIGVETFITGSVPINTLLAWDVQSDSFSTFWKPGVQDVTGNFVIMVREGDTVFQMEAANANDINYLRFEHLKPATIYEIQLFSGSSLVASNRTLTRPRPVTFLSLYSATTTTLGLTWNAPPDNVNIYEICYHAPNTSSGSVTQFDKTTIDLRNLQPGAVYSISVAVFINIDGLTRFSTSVYRFFTTISTIVPSTPDTINVENIDSNTIRLTWELPSGTLEAFELDYSPQYGYPPPPIRMPASQTFFQLEYLLSSTDYQFSLVATVGRKLAKVQSSATIASGRTIDGPFDVQIYNIQDTSAVILYGIEPLADLYRISYLFDGHNSDQDVVHDAAIPRLLRIHDLIPNTTYNVTVIALNSAGTELNILHVMFHTLYPPSVLPTVDEFTATAASLTIPLPSIPAFDNYQIQLHLAGDGGFGAPIGHPVTVEKSVCPRTEIGNLRPDSLYEVVTSLMIGDSRTKGTVIGINTRSLAPLEISLSYVDTTSVGFVWGPATGNFTGYILTYVTPSQDMISITLDQNVNSLIVRDLQPGTIYEVILEQTGGSLQFTTEFTTRPPPPSNLRFQNRRRQSLTAAWDSTQYSFEVCYSPEGNLPSPYTSYEAEVVLGNLQPDTATMVTVYAISRLMTFSYRSSPVTITGRTLIAEPGDVQVVGFTTTTIDLSWIGLPGENVTYRINYYSEGDISVSSTTTSNTEFTLMNLSPGELYNISVVPLDSSFELSTTVQRTRPYPPNNITVLTRDQTFIQLKWSEPPHSTNYQYRLQVYNQKLQQVSQMILPSLKVDVDDLTPGTTYTFVLTAISGNGSFETESTPRNVSTITLLRIDVRAGETSISMLWNEPDVGTFQHYMITYDTENDPQPRTLLSLNNFPGAIISDLTPGSIVTVRVYVINHLQGATIIGSIIISLFPLTVSDLRYTSQRTEVILNWDVSTMYDAFEIDYDPMDGIIPGGSTISQWPVVIQGLTPGQEYNMYVTTISNGVRSTPAGIVALTRPKTIEDFEVTDMGGGDIHIAWVVPPMTGLPLHELLVRILPDGSDRLTILQVLEPGESTYRFPGDPGFYYDVYMTSVVRGRQGEMIESQPVSRGILLVPEAAILNTPLDEEVGATFVDLSWMTTGARLYFELLYQSNSGRNSNRTIDATESSIRLESLIPSSSYNISLEAVSEFQILDGELLQTRSSPSYLSIFTKSLPPRNISAVSVQTTSIKWVWLPPDNTSNTYTYIIQVTNGQLVEQINTTEFTAIGLNDETEYTIIVLSVDGMSESLPLRDTAMTLSLRPSIITGFGAPVVPSTFVTLVWDSPKPSENVTYIRVKVNGLEEIGNGRDERVINASRTSTSLMVTGLRTGYHYNFSIYAVNNHGTSGPTLDGPYMIPETAPPPSRLRVKIVSTATTTMTVEIPNPLFSDVNGPIVQYALLVTIGSENDVISSVPNTYLQAHIFTSLPPYQATPITFKPYDITTRDGSGQYIIGTNEECVLKSNFPQDEYCNGPLQPSTSYRVLLRAYGTDGRFQDSLWSDSAVTGITIWIIIVIIAGISLAVLLVIVLFCCICRCCTPNRSRPIRRGKLHPKNDVNDVTSLEDFRLPGDEEKENNSIEDEVVPELTFYKRRTTIQSSHKKHKKSKRKSRSRTNDSSSSVRARESTSVAISDTSSLVPIVVATPTSNPVEIAKFQEHLINMSSQENAGFKREYETMKTAKIDMKMDIASQPENKPKNRYKDTVPYDATRVKLIDVPTGSTDYINASHIKLFTWHQYISSQGPLPGTVKDFWQMVWENRSTTIVMLTKLVEKEKVRCVQYWADVGSSLTFGDFTVTRTGVNLQENWEIRNLSLTKNDVSMEIRQYHFFGWTDHGIPENPLPMLDFIREVRGTEADNLGPLLVHCSAGCGRSGTYIAVDALLRRIDTSNIHDKIDVINAVFLLRQQRKSMVQTSDQYAFLHRCLAAYIDDKLF